MPEPKLIERDCDEVVWRREPEGLVVSCRRVGEELEEIAREIDTIFEDNLRRCNVFADRGSCSNGLTGKVLLRCDGIFGKENTCGIEPLTFEEWARRQPQRPR